MRIYAQNTEKGSTYYYTNISRTDKDSGKKFFKKLLVGFKKDNAELGNLTPKEWSITFEPYEAKRIVRLADTNEEKLAFVKETTMKLFIWEWEKTEEDKKRDEEDLEAGKSFIKEWKPREEKQEATNTASISSDNFDELLPF